MASNNKHDERLYKLFCPKCGQRLADKHPGQSTYCLPCNCWVQLPKSAEELAKYEVDRIS